MANENTVTIRRKHYKKRFLLFAMTDNSNQYDVEQIPFGLDCVVGTYDTLRGARMAYKAFIRKWDHDEPWYGRPMIEGQILDSKTGDVYTGGL